MKNFWKLVLIVLGVFLFLAGLGIELLFVKICGLLIAVLLLSLVWIWKRKLKLPPGIILYLLFLLAFEASLIWSRNRGITAGHLVSFIAGGLFWIAFYNLSDEFGSWLDKVIIALGIAFGGMFIASHYFGETPIRPWSLYLPYTAYFNHNNIGDFWALVLVVVSFYLIKKPKSFLYWGLVPLGFYFLAMSQSRSAYIALLVGIVYLFKSQGWITKYKKIFTVLVFSTLALFLFIGSQKSILLSRQYYLQGLMGLIHNPFGVGMGNFSIISLDPANHLWGLSAYSSVAHNLILEVAAGMGLLGIFFVVWWVRRLVELWDRKDKKNLIYRTAFFTLTANLFFHSTYFVPTMLWLWFMTLGLAYYEVD
jgi:hypothetical protein